MHDSSSFDTQRNNNTDKFKISTHTELRRHDAIFLRRATRVLGDTMQQKQLSLRKGLIACYRYYYHGLILYDYKEFFPSMLVDLCCEKDLRLLNIKTSVVVAFSSVTVKLSTLDST